MSETGQPVIPSPNAAVSPEYPPGAPGKNLKLWQVVLILAVVAVGVFAGGVTLGKLFFWNQFDRTPLAERQYRTALQKVNENPSNPDYHVELGWALFQKNQYNDALAEYKKALDLNDKHFQANLNLGIAYQEVGKNDLALTAFQKTVEIAPKSFEAHYYLGLSYREAGKLQESLDELQLAYKLNPGSTDLIFAIGQTYEKMGRMDDAKFQYKSALEFDPKFIKAQDALNRLGG